MRHRSVTADQETLHLAQADLKAVQVRYQAAWDEHRDAFAAFLAENTDEKQPRAPYPIDDPRMARLTETRAVAELVEDEYRAATERFFALKRTVSAAE